MTIFTIGKWMHFCRDFQILGNNSKQMELFKRNATNSKELNYDQFMDVLNILAKDEHLELDQYITKLGLDNWKICKEKIKPFQKPFQMRDYTERIKEIKYQFKIFHPEVKDNELIKQILQSRKEQNYYWKHQEREKKEFQKLLFLLKHFTKQQLLEKYPQLSHLIEKLPNPSKPTTCSYQSKEFHKSLTCTEHRESALTWESLNHLPVPSDFIKNLVDEEDDQYLREYQITNQQNTTNVKNKILEQKIMLKKRSLSDYQVGVNEIYENNRYPKDHQLNRQSHHEENRGQRIKVYKILQQQPEQRVDISYQHLDQQKIRQKILERQQLLQLNQKNYSVELSRNYLNQSSVQDESFKREKPSPNKLNISMLKRVQQISGLEAIKEKNLLNQIISQQREKEKIAQK